MDNIILDGYANDLYAVHQDKIAESVGFINSYGDTDIVVTITSYNESMEHELLRGLVNKKVKLTIDVLEDE